MSQDKFSPSWKRSRQPRKQRKYRHTASLHHLQKLFHVHLSPELRKKYGRRSLLVRKGDKVKVMRGQFRKREGKVETVFLKRQSIFVTGIERLKKDGTKIPVPLPPSRLMLTELELGDKKRKLKLDSKMNKEINKEKQKTG